jgi:type VI secretion system secreted protein VgrG
VGSQVPVNYEYGLPDMPVVVGNVFHSQNKQGAKYSPLNNHLKGFQTAGGKKFVLDDAPEAKVIRISNSGKKGTSVELNFKDNGSIKSQGPVQAIRTFLVWGLVACPVLFSPVVSRCLLVDILK